MNKFFVVTLCTGFVILAFCQTPTFFNPETLRAGGDTLKVLYFPTPFIYDWNGDGKKDLLSGQLYWGYITYFQNIGTNSAPVYASGVNLTADGVTIEMAWG